MPQNLDLACPPDRPGAPRAIADAARTDLDRNENLDKIEERIRDAE